MARGMREEACCHTRYHMEQDPHSFVLGSLPSRAAKKQGVLPSREYYDNKVSKECCILYKAYLYSGRQSIRVFDSGWVIDTIKFL